MHRNIFDLKLFSRALLLCVFRHQLIQVKVMDKLAISVYFRALFLSVYVHKLFSGVYQSIKISLIVFMTSFNINHDLKISKRPLHTGVRNPTLYPGVRNQTPHPGHFPCHMTFLLIFLNFCECANRWPEMKIFNYSFG